MPVPQPCHPVHTLRARLGRLRHRLPALAALVPALLLLPAPARAQSVQVDHIEARVASGLNGPSGLAVLPNGAVVIADGAQVVLAQPTQGNHQRSTFYQPSGGNIHGVAAGSDGSVYVADAGNNQVVRLDPADNYTNPVTVASPVANLWGVAVDSSGNVYFSTTSPADVLMAAKQTGGYSSPPQSVFQPPAPSLQFPAGLAWAPDGKLYIADRAQGSGQIVAVNVTSVPSSSVASPVGSLDQPVAVAADLGAGALYVVSMSDSTLTRYPIAGGPGQVLAKGIAFPEGVAVGPDGSVYCAANDDGEVWKLLSSGPTADAGSVGLGLARTLSVAFAFTGTVVPTPVVVDQGQIGGEFNSTGTGSLIPGTTYISGEVEKVVLSFDPDGPGSRAGAVRLVDGAGSLLATAYLTGTGLGAQVGFPGANPPAALAAGARSPRGVAMDAYGTIYYADQDRQQVVKAVPDGIGGYTQTVVADHLVQPYGVAVDGAGDVYFTDFGAGTLQKATWSPATGTYAPAPAPLLSGLESPTHLAVDYAGNACFVDATHDQVLYLPAGGSSATSILDAGDQLAQPGGVAVDGAGNIFITDSGINAVNPLYKVTLAGGRHVTPLTAALDQPHGLAVDGTGAITVAQPGPSGQVLRLVPSGPDTYLPTVIYNATAQPEAVAVDGAGQVVFTDPTPGGTPMTRLDLRTRPVLDFGNVLVGTPTTRRLTLANLGNDFLNFPVPVSGTNPSVPAGFTWNPASGMALIQSGQNGIAYDLDPLGSVAVLIDWTPQTIGPADASLEFKDNDLGGTGTYAILDVPLLAHSVANAAVNLGTLSQTYTGQPLSATFITVPDGLSVSLTYDGSPQPPTHAGRYQVVATVAESDYQGTASGTLTIAPAAATVTLHTADLNPKATGQPLPVGYDVTPAGLPVSVTYDGSSQAPSAAGSYTVVATVTNPDYLGSATGTLTIAAAAPPSQPAAGTTTTLAVTGGAHFGQTLTLRATVAGSGGSPTGTVAFFDGATSLGPPAALAADGTATLALATLAAGSHAFRADYSGDGQYLASEGTASGQILPAMLQIGDGSGQALTLFLTWGAPATVRFPVDALGTLAGGPVTFSVTGLPPDVTATFNPAQVIPGSTETSVELTLKLPAQTAGRMQPGQPVSLPPAGGAGGALLACGLLALPWAGRRRKGLWTGLAVLLALGLLGCWSRNPRAPVAYQASIVAKDATGATVGTAPVALTVER